MSSQADNSLLEGVGVGPTNKKSCQQFEKVVDNKHNILSNESR